MAISTPNPVGPVVCANPFRSEDDDVPAVMAELERKVPAARAQEG